MKRVIALAALLFAVPLISFSQTFLGSEVAYTTSSGCTATTYKYGPVLDLRNARSVMFAIKAPTDVASCTLRCYVEWLAEHPTGNRQEAYGSYTSKLYGSYTYIPQYAVPSTVWHMRERLYVRKDQTMATSLSITASGDYVTSHVAVKAPYARFCFYHQGTEGDMKPSAWVIKRTVELPYQYANRTD